MFVSCFREQIEFAFVSHQYYINHFIFLTKHNTCEQTVLYQEEQKNIL